MTPSELLKMAGYCRLFDNDVAAALRSYAELLSALEWLDHNGSSHAHVNYMGSGYRGMQAQHLLSAAKELGWPGLDSP